MEVDAAMKRIAIRASLFCLILTSPWSVVSAEPSGYIVEAGTLQRLDIATGARTSIGDIGYDAKALAFDARGQLFATDGLELMILDTAVGSAEVTALLQSTFVTVAGMTFDLTDALWVSGETTTGEEGLFQIDTDTGEVTKISSLALSALAARGNRLYAVSEDLVVIDPSPYSEETLGNGFETWADPGTFGPFRNGSGADFDSAGRLWGVLDLRLEVDPPSAFSEIARFDDSGRLTNTFVDHTYGRDLYGLAIAPAVTEVPTLGPRSLGFLALLLALAGLKAQRGRISTR